MVLAFLRSFKTVNKELLWLEGQNQEAILHNINKEKGEVVVECQMFVARLPYSDYSFAMAVKSQSTRIFFMHFPAAYINLGGVPLALVLDNLKYAAKRLIIISLRSIRQWKIWLAIYGTTVVPARA